MALVGLQRLVAELALALPEAEHTCLVGGGAMIEHGLVDRPTEDLDLFSTERSEVARLHSALADALIARGFAVTTDRDLETFVRLTVRHERDSVQVDIALDARIRPPIRLDIGPVAALDELGADKVLALFGRAEPRDLVDVDALLGHLDLPTLMRLAREKDPGFLPSVLARAVGAAAGAPDQRFESLGISSASLLALRERARELAIEVADTEE